MSLSDSSLKSPQIGLTAGTLMACGPKNTNPAPDVAIAHGDHAATETMAAEAAAVEAMAEAMQAEAAAEMATDAMRANMEAGEQEAAVPAHACKGMDQCSGQGGCGVEGQNECRGLNPCAAKGGCSTES